jgi:hypothetical protein
LEVTHFLFKQVGGVFTQSKAAWAKLFPKSLISAPLHPELKVSRGTTSSSSHSNSAQSSLSLLVASAFKSANPNSWSSGAGAHDRGASLGEQQTPSGGGACTLEATSATSASATTSAFRFACS